MSNFLLLLKSVLAGFIVALPIGAIGVLCLRRALQGRWVMGLVTGLGAAIADALLAVAAIFGLTLFTHYILANKHPVLLVVGLFLIVIGIHMILKRRPKLKANDNPANDQLRRWRSLGTALMTGFALTIINPATLVAFVGVFAGLGLFMEGPANLLQGWILVIGAFTGSAVWWAVLTAAAFAVRRHVPLELIAVVNVVLGLVVVGFGVASLLTVFGVEL